MSLFRHVGCLVLLAVVARAIAVPVTIRTIPRDPALTALSTEALIERLQDEAPGDPQRRWPAMVIAFQPLDAPQRFEENLPRDPRSPTMVELIGRGVDAVPKLLDHLTDARPTRLVEFHPPQMINDGGTWFADNYDPRGVGNVFFPPVNHEVDFKTSRQLEPGASYTIKVGDLCFVALGQIVNRRLQVRGAVVKGGALWIRSASLNSPVEFPALATAARRDWAGLTREQHAQSLETDAWGDAVSAAPADHEYGAVQRLLFYYPEVGCQVVAALLRRPLVDFRELMQIAEQLERAPHDRRAILSGYQTTHPAAETAALRRVLLREEHRLATMPDAQAARTSLAAALREAFPDDPTERPVRLAVAAVHDQEQLLTALEPFAWPGLEDLLAEIFAQAAPQSARSVAERSARDGLMLRCATRLKGTRHFARCADALAAEIDSMSADRHAGRVNSASEPTPQAAKEYLAYASALNEWRDAARKLVADR